MSLPKSPDILDILERFPFCWNRDPPHLLAPARDWNDRKTKAADEKGPIPHDGDLKSGTAFCCSKVGEEPQELEIVSHGPAIDPAGRRNRSGPE